MATFSCGGTNIENTCLNESGSGVTTVLVSLLDNSATPVYIPTVNNVGSYMLLVAPLVSLGATANFAASNANSVFAGSAARLTNSPSPSIEEIDIVWNAGAPIALYHSVLKAGGTGALITYRVLIIH